jgi:hypothetical protein
MSWRATLAAILRSWIINELVGLEADDIVDNGFNAGDLVELNAFLDSTYVDIP